jgi:RNA polymerase sigma factor (sigma-70 family)
MIFRFIKTRTTHCTDVLLLEGLRTGEGLAYERAVECLYVRCRRDILAWVQRNSGTEADAEDVFQDAVMALVQKLAVGKTELHATPCIYLLTIAKYIWLTRLRSKKPSSELKDYDLLKDGEAALEEHFLRQIQQDRAYRLCWEKLSERCRSILDDYYFQDLSMAEIAQKHGFSNEKTAKQTKYRCMEDLKNCARTHLNDEL